MTNVMIPDFNATALPENEQITIYEDQIADLGTEGEIKYRLYYLNKSNTDHLDFVCDWIKARDYYALDLETSGLKALDDKIATIQLGDMLCEDPEVIIIDVRMFTPEELAPVLDLICNHGTKLGQNVKFECKFLNGNYGVKVRNVHCTQLTEQIIRAGLFVSQGKVLGETSMAKLSMRYMGITIIKDQALRRGFYNTPKGQHSYEELTYAALDVIYPFYIFRKQMQIATNRGLRSILKIEHQLIPVLAESENRGMHMDKEAWIKLWQKAVQDKTTASQALHLMYREAVQYELMPHKADHKMLQASGKAFNFASAPQVKYFVKSYCESIKWSYEIVTDKRTLLKLKKQYGQEWLEKQRAKKRIVTEENVPDYLIPERYCILVSTEQDELRLARIYGKLPAKLVDLLLEHSTADHLETSFGKKFLDKIRPQDGRLHVEYRQAGVPATGRLSAVPNSMNIPRLPEYRKCFGATPGYKFTIADYSQIEPRLSAQVSGEIVFIEAFTDGVDIYCKVSVAMTGIDPDRATEEGERERNIFKTIVLAMNYRMGPGKLHRSLVLALEEDILAGKVEIPTFFEALDLWKTYLKAVPRLVEYQKRCSKAASPKDTERPLLWDDYIEDTVTWISAPCGRKRFFRPESKATFTEAPNAPIQGCSATITKLAMVLIQEYIDEKNIDAGMVNVIHDEIIYEVEEERAEEFALKQQELMETAARRYITKVPVKADFPKGTKGVVDFWVKG